MNVPVRCRGKYSRTGYTSPIDATLEVRVPGVRGPMFSRVELVSIRPWEAPRQKLGCHTWRRTGVTVRLENRGWLEHAHQMAAHASRRPTRLYDQTKDEITIGEVERIQLLACFGPRVGLRRSLPLWFR
jgi:integrase